ncbi:NAD(P)-dependent oxidoreductase [Lysinibacillus capsici]
MNIGFIGIGKMGKEMLRNLNSQEDSIWIYDANPSFRNLDYQNNVFVADSIEEVGENSELIFLMLPNSTIVEKVVMGEKDNNGLISTIKEGSIVIDMGSSYYFSTLKLSNELDKLGVTFIDAPVSGGVIGAQNGTLTIMVGSYENKKSLVEPYLLKLGESIFELESIGAGHALKAINNFLSATSLFATTEAMHLLDSLNINKKKAIDVINKSSGRSFSTEVKFPKYILTESYNSGFSLSLISKDINTTYNIAKELNKETHLLPLIKNIYTNAILKDTSEQDHTEIGKYYL